jgi:hypothetical protein
VISLTIQEEKLRQSLVTFARNGNTVNYEEAMAVVQLDVADANDRYNTFGKMLDNINRYEHDNNRPMLTAVVTHKKIPGQSSMPGQGFFKVAEMLKKKKSSDEDFDFWAMELKRVFDYWLNH